MPKAGHIQPDVVYDLLMITRQIDEIDYAYSGGKLATETWKKGANTILTLTYTWNPDGTLQKVVRS